MGPSPADVTGEGAREQIISERIDGGEGGKQAGQKRIKSSHNCEHWYRRGKEGSKENSVPREDGLHGQRRRDSGHDILCFDQGEYVDWRHI